MSRRASYATKIRNIYPAKPARIKMGQSPIRSIRVTQRSLVKYRLLNPWWWILHRRGLTRLPAHTDPLEARAVPKWEVRGSLPERIIYRFLVDKLKMADGVDFDFQSSLQGGRLVLGGIVADFLFERMGMIIQVQGPTHTEYRRKRKDEEQRLALEEMGYRVEYIWEDVIYDEYRFEDEMRRIFNYGPATSGASPELPIDWDLIMKQLFEIKSMIVTLQG